MSILGDLLTQGGTAIPLEHGGEYKMQYKEGSDLVTIDCTSANFSLADLNTLQQLLSVVRLAHNLEPKV